MIFGLALPFWDFRFNDFITLGLLLVAWLTWLSDRNKQLRERREARERQVEVQTSMHLENNKRLDEFSNFLREQININRIRDKQITELEKQTIVIGQIAKDIHRRLDKLEK